MTTQETQRSWRYLRRQPGQRLPTRNIQHRLRIYRPRFTSSKDGPVLTPPPELYEEDTGPALDPSWDWTLDERYQG